MIAHESISMCLLFFTWVRGVLVHLSLSCMLLRLLLVVIFFTSTCAMFMRDCVSAYVGACLGVLVFLSCVCYLHQQRSLRIPLVNKPPLKSGKCVDTIRVSLEIGMLLYSF